MERYSVLDHLFKQIDYVLLCYCTGSSETANYPVLLYSIEIGTQYICILAALQKNRVRVFRVPIKITPPNYYHRFH